MSQSKLLRIFNNNGEVDEKLYDKAYQEDHGAFAAAVSQLFKHAYSNKIEKIIYADLFNTKELNIMETENKVKEAYKKCIDSQTNLKNISGFYRKEDA